MGFQSPLLAGKSPGVLKSSLNCVVINTAMQLNEAPSERCMSLRREFIACSAQGLAGQDSKEMNHGRSDGVSWFVRAQGHLLMNKREREATDLDDA